MPTELDITLDRIMDGLTAPGQMFETATIERFGVDLPVFVNAPPNLAAYFAHFCAEHGDATFLVDGDLRLSFAETHAAAQGYARALVKDGLAVGDRVGIAGRNSASWVVSYMAVLMAGGVATLLNGWWTADELAYGIDLAGAKRLIADGRLSDRLADVNHGARILRMHNGAPPEGMIPDLDFAGSGQVELPEIGPDDIATLLYTSGSTGHPKGAFHDHRSVVHGAMSYVSQTVMSLHYLTGRGEAPTLQPSTLMNLPLFHVTAEVPMLLQSFAIGRKLAIMRKWDALEAMRLIEAEQVTYFTGVPLMSYEIATHPERDRFDLSSCLSWAAGGAPRPPEHVSRIRESMGGKAFPLLGYGLTETNAVGCGNLNENYIAKPTSTGKPSRPMVDMAILDDAGAHVPQGHVAEVAIRSICNFRGYWKDEAATAAAITDDGWFRTGDLGYLDEDGYLFIVDRKKDIIIRGGENIATIEVEEALYAHPRVGECAVFAMPDARLGEVPVAVYYPVAGDTLDPEALEAFARERLASFKVPVKFWRSESALPRLGTQKVDKRALRGAYLAPTP